MWKDTRDGYPASDSARAMLDTFTSVGAESFDVTWTTRQGEKADFRRHVPTATLSHFLLATIASAERKERNLIVRPVSRSVAFIQLDDLSEAGLERVKPAAFLGLETSPATTRHGLRFRQGREVRTLPADFAKGQGPTKAPAALPVSPGA